MNDFINWFLGGVSSIDPVARTLIASLGIMLETSFLVGLVIPGDTIVLIASAAIKTPGEYYAMVGMVIFSSLIGETIGFFIGRRFGLQIRGSWLGRKLGVERWRAADNYLDRRGGIAVFLSRFLPVLHSVIPLTVGMSKMRYRQFISWTAAACIIWTVAYVTLAAVLRERYVQLSEKFDWAGWAFIGIVIGFVFVMWVIKKRIARTQAKFMDAPGDGDPNTIDDPLDP
ncbi:MAG: DedA family protein [Actinomycetales bacterium]|nr:DedA family protein [Actinomycetales bacterium]